MKNEELIQQLKNTARLSYENYANSIAEMMDVNQLYDNKQYTDKQHAKFTKTKIPPETFNVIKMYADILIGYYGSVVNDIHIVPASNQYIIQASLLQDIVKHVMRKNSMTVKGDLIKRDGLLHGIMCASIHIEETGNKDKYGRKEREIRLEHVPVSQILLDPSSTKLDYSDARFIHRFKWVSKGELKKLFPKKKAEIDKLNASSSNEYHSPAMAMFEISKNFVNKENDYDEYIITHSIYIDNNDRRWSVYWSGDTILEKKEITFLTNKFPYIVSKITDSMEIGFYGVFHSIIQTQHVINKSLTKILLLCVDKKVYVEKGAVNDIDRFRRQVEAFSTVVELEDGRLNGVKVEYNTAQIAQQANILTLAEQRIMKQLHVNDSMLGMTYASESGRKVALQQNAAAMSLTFQKNKMEIFYSDLGKAICANIQQYYTAEQSLPLTDEITGTQYIEINKPLTTFTGNTGADGLPQLGILYVPEIDPASQEEIVDELGLPIYVPLATEQTDITYLDYQVEIRSTAYNNEEEKDQLFSEVVINGEMGRMMMLHDPAGAMEVFAIMALNNKTKTSKTVHDILVRSAEKIRMQHEQQKQLEMQQMQVNIESGQSGKVGNGRDQEKVGGSSQQLKIGQNGVS